MALTKDKLVTRLQTQIGMTKPESRQIVERLFAIMKDNPHQWRRFAHQRFREILRQAKECTSGAKSSNEGESDPVSAEGFGV